MSTPDGSAEPSESPHRALAVQLSAAYRELALTEAKLDAIDRRHRRPWRLDLWMAVLGAVMILGSVIFASRSLVDPSSDFHGSIRLVALSTRPPARFTVNVREAGDKSYVEIQIVNQCGQGDLVGALILTDEARMSELNASGSPAFNIDVEVRTLEDSRLVDSGVQVVRFRDPGIPCPDGLDSGSVFGTGGFTTGFWSRSMKESRGLTQSVVGPTVRSGDFADVNLVQATFPDETAGQWGGNQLSFIYQEFLGTKEELVGIAQGLESTSPLWWQNSGNVRPTARWGSVDRTADATFRFFLFGTLSGVGASILATVFYETTKAIGLRRAESISR